jgi:hypothetical protein
LDILNPSDFEAGIFMASPALGLRPSQAGRSLTENLPDPPIAVSSPFLAALTTIEKTDETISFALALGRSLASATASASSVVFNGYSFGYFQKDCEAASPQNASSIDSQAMSSENRREAVKVGLSHTPRNQEVSRPYRERNRKMAPRVVRAIPSIAKREFDPLE